MFRSSLDHDLKWASVEEVAAWKSANPHDPRGAYIEDDKPSTTDPKTEEHN